MRASALFLIGTLLLTGCITVPGGVVDPAALPGAGGSTTYLTDRAWSTPLSPALYEKLEAVKELVPSFDGTPISISLQFPAIPGCDWSADAVPEECKLPAVMDAGPYWADHIDRESFRPPIAEWLVPRGYVVAYMSIRGTGESGGCMELFSPNEQKDVDAMVTWLAEQPWSTGNIGMMGRSYDGTTPLMAAALGNPHLKTIVPISSVPSLQDMMFKNGTSELRGPIFHNYVYWFNYGLGGADGGQFGHRLDHAPEQACAEVVEGTLEGARATATGDATAAYWQERDFRQRILENYDGSIWIVHGLEDWNVNPSQVVPWINELQDAGIKTKAWLGVWGHAYPDRVDEHRNVRWDWADQVVRWFDSELKGLPVDTGPAVEVEDSLFVWRVEESYPPRDAAWLEMDVAGPGPLVGDGAVSWQSEPLEDDLRIAGLPQLHVQVTPTTPRGGYLFAELYDVFPDGRTYRIGWAAIDLPHHAGGNDAPATLVPGQPVTAMMEFEPLDAHVGVGHALRIVFHKNGVEDVLPSPSPELLLVGDGVLRLPTVERPDLPSSYRPDGLS